MFSVVLMKTGFLVFLLFTLCQAVTNFRMSTLETTRLYVEDTLVSTLGLFRATLIRNGCKLSIEAFGANDNYTKIG
jgi:hypothetical protein